MDFALAAFALALLGILATSNAITDPLPTESIKPIAVAMRCPGNKEYKWKKTEPVGPDGKDITIFYSCGEKGEEKQKVLQCPKGNKATYRRDLIPKRMLAAAKKQLQLQATKRQNIEYNQEPNFGIFSTSGNPNVLNSAAAVYACMKQV